MLQIVDEGAFLRGRELAKHVFQPHQAIVDDVEPRLDALLGLSRTLTKAPLGESLFTHSR